MTVTAAVATAQEAGRNYITIASEFLGQDYCSQHRAAS
jgi:hypothetical protein